MFSQKKDVIAVMNRMVVTSLYTDGQDAASAEHARLREEMTQSVTNPIYAIVDPVTMKKLAQFDYNQAKDPSFADRLEKALRRFERIDRRRGRIAEG